jgi:hypothetical protein
MEKSQAQGVRHSQDTEFYCTNSLWGGLANNRPSRSQADQLINHTSRICGTGPRGS